MVTSDTHLTAPAVPVSPRRPLLWRALGPCSGAGWALSFLLLLLALGQMFVGMIPQDEGELLTYPSLIARGVMPYRHLWMMYPPATYALLAGLLKVGVPGLIADRGLGIAARMAYVLLAGWGITRSWRRPSPLGVLMAFSLLFLASTDMRAYPWLVAAPLTLAGLLGLKERPSLAAVAFGLAGTCRYEYGLAGIVALGAVALFTPLSLRRHLRALLPALWLVAGLAAYYLTLRALAGPAALHDIFVDPIAYIGPRQHRHLFPPTFGPLFVPIELLLLLPLPLFAVALRRGFPALAAGNLAVLALLPHFLNTADVAHLFSLASLVLPWSLISLSELLRNEETWQLLRMLDALTLAGAVWPGLLLVSYAVYLSPLSPLSPLWMGDVGAREVQGGGHVILASTDKQAAADRAVVAFLNAHAGPAERVFIAPRSLHSTYTMTDLYYVLRARPASRYLEYEAGVVTRPAVQQEIIQSLRGCRWVLQVQGGEWYSPDHLRDLAPLDAYIAAHYAPVMVNGVYRVLERSA